jgi:hypothetical protein
LSGNIAKHIKTFYGRPKADLTRMQDLLTQARSRFQRRTEKDQEFFDRALAGLTEDQRETVRRYVETREEDFGLFSSLIILDWVLGEGLDPQMFRRTMTVPWGEELVERYGREQA